MKTKRYGINKPRKHKLVAQWEILSSCEYLENKEEVTHEDMLHIYKGNFIPLLLAKRVGYRQTWKLSIETHVTGDDGNQHTHLMEWSFNEPMHIKEVLDGTDRVLLNSDGVLHVWEGITKQWTQAVDNDMEGVATKAIATATCIAEVKPNHGYINYLN